MYGDAQLGLRKRGERHTNRYALTSDQNREGTGAKARATPASVSPAVHWVGLPSAGAGDEWAYRTWHASVLGDPNGAVYLHPDVVFADREIAGKVPIVYASGERSAHPECFGSLAVLAPRGVRVQIAPGLPYTVSLRGLRVLDNRLLGDNSAESLKDFVAALVELVRNGPAECVLFQDLDMESPLRQAIAQAGQGSEVSVWYPSQPLPHWWIRFPDPAEGYWRQFSKKTRYNFRYRAKRLEHTMVCIREPNQVPGFLAKAQLLSRHTWQYRRLGMEVDADGQEQQFWEQIAALGAMRSYVLEQNGHPLAYAIGVQWKGHFSFEKTGYDPAYATYSPGNVLLYRALEDLIGEDTPRLFDFGYGHSEYKEIFANHRTMSGPVALVRRAWRPTTVMLLDRIQRQLGQGSRALLRRAGILQALRRLYHR